MSHNKCIVPISGKLITEELFNEYDIYYRVNGEDYRYCLGWGEYLNKRDIYLDWCIRVEVKDIGKFIDYMPPR